MLGAEAVDVLQADVTRCAGITQLQRIDALCRSRPLSLHCSPTIHANLDTPGHGAAFRWAEAEPYAS